MAYRIRVEGEERTSLSVLKDSKELRASLQATSHVVANMVEREMQVVAPHRPGERGVFDTNVKTKFRLAGRAKGGGALVSQTISVELLVKDPSVAAFVEWGTGIYASSERQGPRTGWTIGPRKGAGDWSESDMRGLKKDLYLGPMQRPGGDKFWARTVHIEGAKPKPYIDNTLRMMEPAIDRLYEQAVDAAI
jgi:hypothetical protein